MKRFFLAAALVTVAGWSGAVMAQNGQPASAPAQTAPAKAPDVKQVTRPTVTMVTEKGTIVMELYPDEAPKTVANFIQLVKKGFYDGLTFHRVVPGFVIQGGDPSGNGTGGPGYKIPNEANKKLKHTVGTVAMANAGRDTAGSQFYIVITNPAPNLDEKYPDGVNKYTMFGKVVSGQDVAEKIAVGDRMTKVTVVEPEPGAAPVAPKEPVSKESHVAMLQTQVPVAIPYIIDATPPKNTKPKVKVTIDDTGKVSQVDIKSGTGVSEIDKAVKDAMMKWQWSAAMKDGKTVKSDRTFVYDIINRSIKYD